MKDFKNVMSANNLLHTLFSMPNCLCLGFLLDFSFAIIFCKILRIQQRTILILISNNPLPINRWENKSNNLWRISRMWWVLIISYILYFLYLQSCINQLLAFVLCTKLMNYETFGPLLLVILAFYVVCLQFFCNLNKVVIFVWQAIPI